MVLRTYFQKLLLRKPFQLIGHKNLNLIVNTESTKYHFSKISLLLHKAQG